MCIMYGILNSGDFIYLYFSPAVGDCIVTVSVQTVQVGWVAKADAAVTDPVDFINMVLVIEL